MKLIESTGIALAGVQVVCVGASTIVGRPVAALLMEAKATVVSTNIHTQNLAEHTRRADVVIAAAGVPGLLTGDMIKPHSIVIDVGINRITDADTGKKRTVGDVDVESVLPVASHLSPVPGGVGPMTVAMLLCNTVAAAAPR
jgi:methylenetetrahydrofolate dehydrogenase (NADP+)/methenyltetrahydrofolate cyclohydrolase